MASFFSSLFGLSKGNSKEDSSRDYWDHRDNQADQLTFSSQGYNIESNQSSWLTGVPSHSAISFPAAPTTRCFFRFACVEHEVEKIKVLGSCAQLGHWDVNDGVELNTSYEFFPCYLSRDPVILPLGIPVEYNYVIIYRNGECKWATGSVLTAEGLRKLQKENHSSTRDRDDTNSLSYASTSTHHSKKHDTHRHDRHGDRHGDGDNHNNRRESSRQSQYDSGRDSSGEEPGFDKIIIDNYAKDGVLQLLPTGTEMTIEDDGGLFRQFSGKMYSSENNEKQPDSDGGLGDTIVVDPYATGLMKVQEMESEIEWKPPGCQILFVMFQLPWKAVKSEDGTWAITSVKNHQMPSLTEFKKKFHTIICVGWPGVHVTSEYEKRQIVELLAHYDCVPVFPPREDFESFVSFSHHFLWPIFHDVMTNMLGGTLSLDEEQWGSYQKVNSCYADAVTRHSHQNDLFWIHGYHLLLLPQYLTRKIRKANIGLYIHTPFPSFDIFRCLPVRDELLRAMLCADQVGFQFFEHARKFFVTIKRMIGLDYQFAADGRLSVPYGGRDVQVKVGHMCISAAQVIADCEKTADVLLAMGEDDDEEDNDGKREAVGRTQSATLVFHGLDSAHPGSRNRSKDRSSKDRMGTTTPTGATTENTTARTETSIQETGILKGVAAKDGKAGDSALSGTAENTTARNVNATSSNMNAQSLASLEKDAAVGKDEDTNTKIRNIKSNTKSQSAAGFAAGANQKSGEMISETCSSKGMGERAMVMTSSKEVSDKQKIDSKEFPGEATINKKEQLRVLFHLREDYPGKTIFAGLDRCESLAGMMLKLRSFQEFLQEFPMYRDRVLLVQCAFPSAAHVVDQGKIERDLIGLCTEINETFGAHIVLIMGEIDRDDKYALFRAADVFLDTQVKDGLNFSTFEFLACHAQDKQGLLIISEFTGASTLLHGALRVNPWNTTQVVAACERCCRMTIPEKEERFIKDFNYVMNHKIDSWCTSFITDIRAARKKDDMNYVSFGFGANYRLLSLDASFRRLDSEPVIQAYRHSKTCRVFFLDNEGTLGADVRTRFARVSNVAAREVNELHAHGAPPSPQVLACLTELLTDTRNIVVIISGRPQHQLQEWFSSVPGIGLAAEHGFCYKLPSILGEEWYTSGIGDFSWKKIAFELMRQYVLRTQGSYIENKGSALVWQYRDSDPEFGLWQAKELSQHLQEFMFGYPVEVLSGKGFIEVKVAGVNKGVAVTKILNKISKIQGDPDFILCIGDDRSDEDMFEVINTLLEEHHEDDAETSSVNTNSWIKGHPPPGGGLLLAAGGTVVGADRSTHKLGLAIAGMGNGSSAMGNGGGNLGITPTLNQHTLPGVMSLPGGMGGGMETIGSRLANTIGGLSAHTTGGVLGSSVMGSLHQLAANNQVEDNLKRQNFFSCTVGQKPSKARFFLHDTDEVSEVLEALKNTVSSTLKADDKKLNQLTMPPGPEKSHGRISLDAVDFSGENSSSSFSGDEGNTTLQQMGLNQKTNFSRK